MSEKNGIILELIGCIKAAEPNGALYRPSNLTGFSGNKIIGALQRFPTVYSNLENVCYLEVGVFQGLTLLSVASACKMMPCYGIDNFAYFDPENKNLSTIQKKTSEFRLTNVGIINRDYEDALEKLDEDIGGKKVAVYFIGGPHDYRSQLMCLELALPYLHDNAIVLVDDCNYRHVRQANRDFLVTHPEWKLLFEAYTTCHPVNMNPEDQKEARQGWWNGVNVLVRDPLGELLTMYPPTERSRQVFENEHFIHATKIAEIAPEAILLVQAFYSLSIVQTVRSFLKLPVLFFRNGKMFKERFNLTNTHSEGLQGSHYNKYRTEVTTDVIEG